MKTKLMKLIAGSALMFGMMSAFVVPQSASASGCTQTGQDTYGSGIYTYYDCGDGSTYTQVNDLATGCSYQTYYQDGSFMFSTDPFCIDPFG